MRQGQARGPAPPSVRSLQREAHGVEILDGAFGGGVAAVEIRPALVVEFDFGADRAGVSAIRAELEHSPHVELAVAGRRKVEHALAADLVLEMEVDHSWDRVGD